MHSLFVAATVAVAVNLLLCLPYLLRWASAVRLRHLCAAQTRISHAAFELQKYMANRTIMSGSILHDRTARFINDAQYFRKYLSIRPLLRGKRDDVRQYRERLERELSVAPKELRSIEEEFFLAYFVAALWAQPFMMCGLFALFTVKQLFTRKRAKAPRKVQARIIPRRPFYVMPSCVPTGTLALWAVAIGATSATFQGGTLGAWRISSSVPVLARR